MARFPLPTSDVISLAGSISNGLRTNPQIFPAPPAAPDDLDETIAAAREAQATIASLKGALAQAITANRALMAQLRDLMKMNLRYAENITHFEDAPLVMLGWSARRAKKPRTLPGACMGLRLELLGTKIRLQWEAPTDGGGVSAYTIEKRTLGQPQDLHWQIAYSVVGTETIIPYIPNGATTEYRVMAINRAGKGGASNIVAVG